MKISVTVPNLTPLVNKMHQFPTIVAPFAQQAINDSINAILGQEKTGANTPVRTGHLKNDWTIALGGLQGTLTSQAPYAAAIQGGTKAYINTNAWGRGITAHYKARPANPFMTRAIDLAMPQIQGFFAKALTNSLTAIASSAQ